jgi:hypothetical protein
MWRDPTWSKAGGISGDVMVLTLSVPAPVAAGGNGRERPPRPFRRPEEGSSAPDPPAPEVRSRALLAVGDACRVLDALTPFPLSLSPPFSLVSLTCIRAGCPDATLKRAREMVGKIQKVDSSIKIQSPAKLGAKNRKPERERLAFKLSSGLNQVRDRVSTCRSLSACDDAALLR